MASYGGQVAAALLWQHGYPDPEKAPPDALATVLKLVTAAGGRLRALQAWGVPPQEAARRIEASRWAVGPEQNQESNL